MAQNTSTRPATVVDDDDVYDPNGGIDPADWDEIASRSLRAPGYQWSPLRAPGWLGLESLAPRELGEYETPDWGYWLNEFPFAAYLAWIFSGSHQAYEAWFVEHTGDGVFRFYDPERLLRDENTRMSVASAALNYAAEEDIDIPGYARERLERDARGERLASRSRCR